MDDEPRKFVLEKRLKDAFISIEELLILSATEVGRFMLPLMVLFAWVGIPLLRFHPHPSQCRSIGQTIGLTAYPPQRAAIFTMPLLTRTFPAYFRLRALFEASDISTTSEPTVPSGIVPFGPADPVCANHLSCKGSLTPRPEVGSLHSPHYGHSRANAWTRRRTRGSIMDAISSPNRPPVASIVIPNYQGADCLLECVQSILTTTTEDIELIVVDNASPDKSGQILRSKMPNVRLIQLTSNQGYGEACNTGARNASGTYLIFLNNDTVVQEGWLRELISHLRDPKNGAVCSKVMLPGTPETIDSCGGVSDIYGFAWSRGKGEVDQGQYDDSPGCFYAVGSSLAIRRDVFETVGGFDKELFMYLEDVDLSWRLQLLGLRVLYVPGSKVMHKSGITRMKTTDIQYLFNRNRLRMILKNYSLGSLISILPRYLVLQVGLVMWVISRLRGDELRTIFAAWLWNARHLRDTIQYRRLIQARRKVDDSSVTRNMIKKPAGIMFLLGMIRNPVLKQKFR